MTSEWSVDESGDPVPGHHSYLVPDLSGGLLTTLLIKNLWIQTQGGGDTGSERLESTGLPWIRRLNYS